MHGIHGGGLWSSSMTPLRLNGIRDWMSKAPPAYADHEAALRNKMSRHWQGNDLQQPAAAQSGHGRRETDVRGVLDPGRTLHPPDGSGLLMRRAYAATPQPHP